MFTPTMGQEFGLIKDINEINKTDFYLGTTKNKPINE